MGASSGRDSSSGQSFFNRAITTMAVGMFAAFTVYSFATTFAKISDQQDKAERAKILAKLDARTKEVNRLEAELASGPK